MRKLLVILLYLLCAICGRAQEAIDFEVNEAGDTIVVPTKPLGYIFSVHDGDSYVIQLAQKTKVRLMGVDCPEVFGGAVGKTQPYGRMVADSVRELIKGKVVKYRSYGLDQYARTLMQVTVDGKDLAELILEKGWGWYVPARATDARKLSTRTRGKYIAAEKRAKKESRGLHAGYINEDGEVVKPIEPWEWRKLFRVSFGRSTSPALAD